MTNKRKICLPCLFLAVAILVLSGCGKKSLLDPKNPVSIEIWHYYNGTQKIAFDDLVTEFNDTLGLKQGITVEAFSQGNVSELTGKIIDAANKKVGAPDIPDVFAAYADTALQIDKMGLVAQLDPYMTPDELAEYVPSYIDEGRFDEKRSLKIFPIAKSTETLMLNKTDWEKFSGETGAQLESLSTYEGIAQTAKAYYDWTDAQTPQQADDGKAFFGRDAMANYFIIGARQLGIEIFAVKDGKTIVSTDETMMRRLWDQFYIPYINGYYTAIGKFRSDDAKTGDLIALVGSTTGAAYFPKMVTVGDTFHYPIESLSLPAPYFEGGEQYAVQQGAGMVVSTCGEAKEYAATIFLKWFTDLQRNADFSVASGYLPVKTAANDPQLMEKSFLTMGEEASNQLKNALLCAIDMMNRYTFYSTQAFEGGTNARAILENSMIERAKADRAEVIRLMKTGASREVVVAQFTGDAYFQTWLQEFRGMLEQAAQ